MDGNGESWQKNRWSWKGRPVRAILFDVDGTLYHQGRMRRAMALRILKAHVLQPWLGLSTFRSLQAYRRAQETLRAGRPIDGDLSEAQFRLVSSENDSPVRDIVCRWMEQEPLKLVLRFRFDDLEELLAAARAAGLKLGVFSDYPATGKLEAMGLLRYFDAVVCAQDRDVQRFKPDPRGLQIALQRLGVESGDALYVGDRPKVDAEAARAAGMRFCILGQEKGVRCYRQLIERLNGPAASR